jgi:DNA-binding NarL/FixJ family response regulator
MNAPVQIKKLSFRGDRDKLLKAGIPFLKTRREINIQHLQKVDPYFVVVDDRMSSGNTAATVRKVFQQATGVEIPNDHVYMLSLFDTTKRS